MLAVEYRQSSLREGQDSEEAERAESWDMQPARDSVVASWNKR